jgi:signal transduction histidine kinase
MVLLLSTLGLAGIMAYQALLATKSHDLVAHNARRDHAHSAAWQLSSAIHWSLAVYFLEPSLDMVGKLGGAFPGEPFKDLPTVRKSVKDLAASWEGWEGFDFVFRWDLTTDELTIRADSAPSPENLQWLKATLKDEIRIQKGLEGQKEGQEEGPRALAFHDIGSEERMVAFAFYPHTGPAETAFGFQSDLVPFKTLLKQIEAEFSLLPPTLAQGKKNRDLLSFVVTTPNGKDVYRSFPEYSPEIEVTDGIGRYLGYLSATVRLNPEAADFLVIGGLPKDRLPTILVLLGLTTAMIIVAIFQLRREQELALLRTDFVSSVSHQLRTPLAQIRMFGETLLLGRVRNEKETQKSLEIIVKEAQRLTHQVDNVLHFSRAQRGEISLSAETTVLAPIVSEVLESFCPLAEAEGCRVEASLDETLAAKVDPGAFRQILINLLENAVKYGPPGQIVDVRLRKGAAETVQLLVEDEGKGIPEDQRFEVFAPYSRLERDRDSGVAGSGIGLAVVQELVRLQGGMVRVEDAVSGGARFVVAFPREMARGGEHSSSGPGSSYTSDPQTESDTSDES